MHYVSSVLWSHGSFRFCSLLILSRAEGDHRTFNKVSLKYTEESCVLLFCRINIAAACSKQQNENNLHSNHSQDIPGAVKEFFTRPKAVWEENRHNSETRERRTEPDGLLWHGTAVNRRHSSLFGYLLALSQWTEELIYRWPVVGFKHDCVTGVGYLLYTKTLCWASCLGFLGRNCNSAEKKTA